MARQLLPLQINQFVGGLNTEANPLNLPPNSTSDEQNMEINLNGTRSRRNGFDLEDGWVNVNTGVKRDSSVGVGRSQFLWENPGGEDFKQFVVIQIGSYLGVHDLDVEPLSDGLIFSHVFAEDTYTDQFRYAVVDGILVIVTGNRPINLLLYDDGNITLEQTYLRIRDLFGVEGNADGVNMTEIENIQFRPSTLKFRHLYNLRNQTWALPRADWGTNSAETFDPIDLFYNATENTTKYPSNADLVNEHYAANADLSDKLLERYNGNAGYSSQAGLVRAPQGYFIIDALRRGESRQEQETLLRQNNPELKHSVQNLRIDRTPGGPSVVAQYAGRVWFGGFSSELVDGDTASPRLGSYIMYSQIVQSKDQITRCYQKADPTSTSDPDLVADDGGFLKIDGAYGIEAMLSYQSSLFVFAQNGIWRIAGADGDSFQATSPSVFRLSEYGCVAGASVVERGGTLFFWGRNAIYAVSQNEFGDWSVQDITQDTIKTHYNSISDYDKSSSIGYYDHLTNSIRWVYGTQSHYDTDSNELILNLKYQSFTKNRIFSGGLVRGIISVCAGQPIFSAQSPIVTAVGAIVTANGSNVTAGSALVPRSAVESLYCVLLSNSVNLRYTFGGYKTNTVTDWVSRGGIDTPAYLTTNAATGGDPRLLKNTPYVTVYFNREDIDYGVLDSSCFLSSRWDWASSASSGKWSSPRQVYRVTRPTDGNEVISTRNRIRGWGRSVSLHFESEEAKAMHIYGWSHNLESTNTE